jgi:nicotinate-nucleotide adenylyltransferase
MRRIGIYSGTFDPVHEGHLAFARHALQDCELDEVIFLPEAEPRGKHAVTDLIHRTMLLEHATRDVPRFRVISLDSKQFTVQHTLPELRGLLGDADLTFLIGSDVAHTFPFRWEGLDTLCREVAFAIGLRARDDPAEVDAILTAMKQTYSGLRYTYIQTPAADVASSQIREGARTHTGLPPAVQDYIRQHGLYQ